MAVATDSSKFRVRLFSHAIKEEDLEPGDHIYVHRKCGLYTHHGIYVGGHEDHVVIHFSGLEKKNKATAIVESCSLKEFLDGSKLRLVVYNAPHVHRLIKKRGSCHYNKSRPASEVTQTAYEYLQNPQKWGTYNLFTKNCEHFAVFCKTQRNAASQLEISSIKGLLSSMTYETKHRFGKKDE